jgi:hypothetical protein
VKSILAKAYSETYLDTRRRATCASDTDVDPGSGSTTALSFQKNHVGLWKEFVSDLEQSRNSEKALNCATVLDVFACKPNELVFTLHDSRPPHRLVLAHEITVNDR